MPPDPIVINHTIMWALYLADPNLRCVHCWYYIILCPILFSVEGPDAAKKAAAYDVEVEVDDPKKAQMTAFMMSSQHQQVCRNIPLSHFTWCMLWVVLYSKFFSCRKLLPQTQKFMTQSRKLISIRCREISTWALQRILKSSLPTGWFLRPETSRYVCTKLTCYYTEPPISLFCLWTSVRISSHIFYNFNLC